MLNNNQHKHELAQNPLFDPALASQTLKREKEQAILKAHAHRLQNNRASEKLAAKRRKEEIVRGLIKALVMSAITAIVILAVMFIPWGV